MSPSATRVAESAMAASGRTSDRRATLAVTTSTTKSTTGTVSKTPMRSRSAVNS